MKFIRANAFALLSLLISICVICYFSFFANNKVVYVDSGRLLTGYKAMVVARGEFEKKQDVWKNNVDSLTTDVENAIKTYSKTAALGTDKEKQLAKDLINSKQKELYDYQNAIKQNEGEEQQRLTKDVYATINAYLLRYGKEHSYKLILIASNGNIGYADGSIDITDKIIDDLNKDYTVPVK
jgi:outer membrane protein